MPTKQKNFIFFLVQVQMKKKKDDHSSRTPRISRILFFYFEIIIKKIKVKNFSSFHNQH